MTGSAVTTEVESGAPSRRGAATARDVAREAGVHQSTVSRALDPAQMARVSAETRERVQQAALRLDYQPHLGARHLRRQRSMTIGVLIPSFRNPIYGSLVRGIDVELERLGYQAVVIDTRDADGRLAHALGALQGRRVDGIICGSARDGDVPALERVAESGLPLVLAMRSLGGRDWVRVVNDDEAGGRLAAEHLASLGHRRLAEIAGPREIATFPARSHGFRSAAAAAGVEVVPFGELAAAPVLEEGRRVGARLLDAHGAAVTGVFAHNDLLAVGVISALRARGLDCPRDVSIVGYNDSPLTEFLDPPLSTVRMPVDEMGRLAAQRIVELVDGSTPSPSAVSLEPRLIARASTRALRPEELT